MSNLVIPWSDRDMVVMHTDTQPDTVKGTLNITVDEGTPIKVGVELANPHSHNLENPRARRAVLMLTGIHFQFYGEVTIFDLDDDTIREVMEGVS